MSKLIYGVGINDAEYLVQNSFLDKEGNRINWCCPYYSRWTNMLKRCYSDKFKVEITSYKECTVCEEWLTFSNFKNWMENQDWEGKHLDKDILNHDKGVYSPEGCMFVYSHINNLVKDNPAIRGKYKRGVSWNSSRKVFQSRCKIGTNKVKYLGSFSTELEAHKAYIAFKANRIREVADTQEERIKNGLYRHAKSLEGTLKQG